MGILPMKEYEIGILPHELKDYGIGRPMTDKRQALHFRFLNNDFIALEHTRGQMPSR
jgi:hypothetical protein